MLGTAPVHCSAGDTKSKIINRRILFVFSALGRFAVVPLIGGSNKLIELDRLSKANTTVA